MTPSRKAPASWNSQEWKNKRNKRIKGKVCEQCGSSEVMQIHHNKKDKMLFDVMQKNIIIELLKQKMDSGETPFKGRRWRDFTCGHCGSTVEVRNPRYRNKTCPTCGKKSAITNENCTVHKEYNIKFSRSEMFFFFKRYEKEINGRLKRKGAPPRTDYMNLDQDTVVLCKTCHYALENGHDLCPVCKKNYKKIGTEKCTKCMTI